MSNNFASKRKAILDSYRDDQCKLCPEIRESETTVDLNELQQRIWQINEDKGFHEDRPQPMMTIEGKVPNPDLAHWQGNKLMLIVSEAVEAHDEIRNGKPANMTYYPTESLFLKGPHKPEGVPSEIADIVIRCFDFAGTEGFDLGQIIEEKIAYNATRERLHGKAF